MFTGIVEKVGRITRITAKRGLHVLEIETEAPWKDVAPGDSIAVNGVCLTVTGKNRNRVTFDVMSETLSKSNLCMLKVKDAVNIERSLKVNSYLSGHFVYGHIDGMRKIVAFRKDSGRGMFEIGLRTGDYKYVVDKGSIAVDGISLTIGKVFSEKIRIFIIPHTLSNTILPHKKVGDVVNVEFDILAKYILRQSDKGSGVTERLLRDSGFMS